MTQNRYFSNLAQGTFITNSGGLTTSTTALIVQSTTKWPTQFPFTVRAEPGTANEELILVLSGSGTAGIPYQIQRGFDGTNPLAHRSGVSIIPGFCQLDLSQPQQHLNLNTPTSGAHGLPSSAWGGGTMQLLNTQPANSSSLLFTSIPATFNHLRIVYAFQANGTGGSVENGVDVFSAMLNSAAVAANWNGIFVRDSSTAPVLYKGSLSNGAPIGGLVWNSYYGSPSYSWGTMDFPFYTNSGSYKGFTSQSYASDGGSAYTTFNLGGSFRISTPITEITLQPEGSSTAFISGNAWLYGIL